MGRTMRNILLQWGAVIPLEITMGINTRKSPVLTEPSFLEGKKEILIFFEVES